MANSLRQVCGFGTFFWLERYKPKCLGKTILVGGERYFENPTVHNEIMGTVKVNGFNTQCLHRFHLIECAKKAVLRSRISTMNWQSNSQELRKYIIQSVGMKKDFLLSGIVRDLNTKFHNSFAIITSSMRFIYEYDVPMRKTLMRGNRKLPTDKYLNDFFFLRDLGQ